jgi:hypothetical protein
MGSTSGLNRQLIATGHGDDQWMDWGPYGPPFLGRMTNPNQLPNQAGDMQGIFLDLKWSRSLYQPLSYRKTPNGVKLHVFFVREHQQAIISGDGVFSSYFQCFL